MALALDHARARLRVLLHAQDGQRYRDYRMGATLIAIATQTGVEPAAATLVHQRPAVIQELTWRPPCFLNGSSARQTDPVAHILFGFYNDQLFRMVVAYDSDRTEGLTDADLVEVISGTYGVAAKPAARNARVVSNEEGREPDTLIARWVTTDSSVSLIRVTYPVSYQLIVLSLPLEGLARSAAAEAERLDRREAPQRALALEKKASEDSRAAQETRLANKAAFKP